MSEQRLLGEVIGEVRGLRADIASLRADVEAMRNDITALKVETHSGGSIVRHMITALVAALTGFAGGHTPLPGIGGR